MEFVGLEGRWPGSSRRGVFKIFILMRDVPGLAIATLSILLLLYGRAFPSSAMKVIVERDGKKFEVDIEEYVEGVVLGEIPESWPDEVIKAQSVVSRSYVLYINQNESKVIKGSQKHQVWVKGFSQRVSRLVKETKGWVLSFSDGSVAPGFFHSTCGGMTENAWEIWGGDERMKEIVSVKCTKCYDSPLFFWKRKMKLDELRRFSRVHEDPVQEKLLKVTGGGYGNLLLERTSTGRIVKLIIPRDSLTNVLFYHDMREFLPSNFFEIEVLGDLIQFYGRGWGHGVGMCQWGAKKLAEEGYSWQEILNFYFPKLRLRKVY